MIPTGDPFIMLSAVNMKLRDEYPTLDELCAAEDIDRDELINRLAQIGFVYNPTTNQFR